MFIFNASINIDELILVFSCNLLREMENRSEALVDAHLL